jgi:hypothetical protein
LGLGDELQVNVQEYNASIPVSVEGKYLFNIQADLCVSGISIEGMMKNKTAMAKVRKYNRLQGKSQLL